jgi:predicted ArsR family transcriptional regulator
VKPPEPIDLVPPARRELLRFLKTSGWSTIPRLARALSVSPEAVRQQLQQLEVEGWVTSNCGPDEARAASRQRGRPAVEYCLSRAAEDLFPKRYPQLAVDFFDALEDETRYLTRLTNQRVAAVENAPSLREKLRSIYVEDDPFMTVEKSGDGYRLIERNCPYLQFAMQRPLFCSSTVSALRRLSGCEVVREERFQDGAGRCVFHVLAGHPLPPRRRKVAFEVEPPKSGGDADGVASDLPEPLRG